MTSDDRHLNVRTSLIEDEEVQAGLLGEAHAGAHLLARVEIAELRAEVRRDQWLSAWRQIGIIIQAQWSGAVEARFLPGPVTHETQGQKLVELRQRTQQGDFCIEVRAGSEFDIFPPVLHPVRYRHNGRNPEIAGLLNGRRATTHWKWADVLASRYPAVHVDPDVLYVADGPVITSAGTAAGIDACLHLLRLEHGAAVANAVARRMVVPPHRDGGQAQYVPVVVNEAGDPANLAAVQQWTLEHLAEPISVDDLAARAVMSPRNFARQFAARTGTTPHQWLIGQRLSRAQELLEHTGEPVEQIAAKCGLSGVGSGSSASRVHPPMTTSVIRS